ncbi:uncharacterized protein BX663DRAFT_498809, partial [Cokeromyces recurvatus]|uniref:uncharacterized protein n=1 Tax=Cokeromyces recurvatus TaxID=90255 RepID=UPI002220F64D
MNNAEAGPSSFKKIAKPDSPMKLELAQKNRVFEATLLEDLFDYSVLVSNNISMARDQLANERNWLTWFRLSCTLVILGFTILIKFRLPDGSSNNDSNFEISSKPVGYIFVAIGFLCSFVGLGKYFKNQRLLIKQATFVEAGRGSYLMVAVLFSFVCTIMILASTKNNSQTGDSFVNRSFYMI